MVDDRLSLSKELRGLLVLYLVFGALAALLATQCVPKAAPPEPRAPKVAPPEGG